MKKSIFMKRKSNESSISPRAAPTVPQVQQAPQVPQVLEQITVQAMKNTPTNMNPPKVAISNNPFTFSNAKKATNDIIQNEILKKEILKRKSEEMNLKPKSPIVSFRYLIVL